MRMGKIVLFLLLYPLFGQSETQNQLGLKNQTFVAKVIRIMDGDTLEILYKNKPIKIRLAHIDCPEKRSSQPFNHQSKKALSDLCFGQQVSVYAQKYDRYGRLIAVIINTKKQVVNQEMIKQGMAWHFKRYSKDPIYAKLEVEARKKKTGLWKDANPIAPWSWRKPQSLSQSSTRKL